jgi:hypothetical protein
MKRNPYAGALLISALSAGLIATGTTSASAQGSERAPQAVTDSIQQTRTIRPPVLLRPRVRCHESGGIVVVKLRNPHRELLHFEVRVFGGDYAEALPVMLPARGSDSVEFHGLADGRYRVEVLTDLGESVAWSHARVRCEMPVRGDRS